MGTLTVSDIVNSISKLGTNVSYEYFSGNTLIKIKNITMTEGPIKFLRWKPDKGVGDGKEGGISVNMLGTVASIFSRKPNYPIQFDRLFSGGGNSRSALETLLAYTPNFYMCYPERSDIYTGEIKNDLKHIMWCPDEQHPQGEIVTREYSQVITEYELDINFGDIKIPDSLLDDEFKTIHAKKTHTQIQVALVRIGNALTFNTWIANNDRSIQVGDSTLGNLPGVIQSLDEVGIFHSDEIKKAASLIDLIWFSSDYKYIPGVIEVEHSTGVTSGLTRMLKFRETIPSVVMNFAIVADRKLRQKVVTEANNSAFKPLKARYMPYSTVRELYGLIQRYNLMNVVERDFIEPFMETIVED